MTILESKAPIWLMLGEKVSKPKYANFEISIKRHPREKAFLIGTENGYGIWKCEDSEEYFCEPLEEE